MAATLWLKKNTVACQTESGETLVCLINIKLSATDNML